MKKYYQTHDEIINFLDKLEGVTLLYKEGGAGEFNRVIPFEVRGQLYTIEWWTNQSTLYIGERKFTNPSFSFKYIGFRNWSCRCNEEIVVGQYLEDDTFAKIKRVEALFSIPIKSNEGE